MDSYQSNEKYLSQITALQVLIASGYKCLTYQEAHEQRGRKTSNILLETTLYQQLTKLNRINYKGNEYQFSEANLQEAIRKLKEVRYSGLLETNSVIYDLITLGTTLEQPIDGNKRSFSFIYIDWKNPENNLFHVVPEYLVEGEISLQKAKPDLVLFVNGIPLCVIECKAPHVEIGEAIEQTIRNQGNEYIPKLFTYVQLVMALNKNEARYATTATAKKFWNVWKELEDEEEQVTTIVQTPLSSGQKAALFSGEFASAKRFYEKSQNEGGRSLYEQDKAVYSLCRPERLLDLTYRFTLFDKKVKKIARYHQFFAVKAIMSRIKQPNAEGSRKGGMIWHTQGTGKSLTMVMLARALVLDKDILNPRLVIVTDRDDLDKQIAQTFKNCGLSQERATSGRNLVKHLKDKVQIITTLIHKFDKGWEAAKFVDELPNIFTLVDESHRTNFGALASTMRQMLPNSCYLGFTGTPLLRKERNNFLKFGCLIEPAYSIKQAVKDKAVVPLLYEGRHVKLEQNKAAIDLLFERHTTDLTKRKQTDLKKKYAKANQLNQTDQVIFARVFDISEHYRKNCQGTKFKAQLVAPNKASALKYHQYLEELGAVSSEVIISPPDTLEGNNEVNQNQKSKIKNFWKKMMKRYGTEAAYNKQLIDNFKHKNEPEILIVVDKLLTGFDAPRNTVLYLCRKLREHSLLQAIARVNRLYENKEYGFILDYENHLEDLNKALTMYDAFEGFSEEDLAGTLTLINKKIKDLSQKHSDLWNLFREVKHKQDEEAFERVLADKGKRQEFYEALYNYSKLLGLALSSNNFIRETPDTKLKEYKEDLKRFQKLKIAVKLRYAGEEDYRDYDCKIKKLLNTHIQAKEIIQLNQPLDILNEQNFAAVVDGSGIYTNKSLAARADIIAHATKKTIFEKWQEDPAFYEPFSKLIKKAIDDYNNGSISAQYYLASANDISRKVKAQQYDDVPSNIRGNREAHAYYGVLRNYLSNCQKKGQHKPLSAAAALSIQAIFTQFWKVDFWYDERAKKRVENAIDDYLYDHLDKELKTPLKDKQKNEIISKTMQIANIRRQVS